MKPPPFEMWRGDCEIPLSSALTLTPGGTSGGYVIETDPRVVKATFAD